MNNPFKSSLQKFLSVTHPLNHPRNQGSSGLLDVLIYFEQGEEEVEEKTLEVLSREAAEFLDEKPSHKRFFHFSFLIIYPHTQIILEKFQSFLLLLLVIPVSFSGLRLFHFNFDRFVNILAVIIMALAAFIYGFFY